MQSPANERTTRLNEAIRSYLEAKATGTVLPREELLERYPDVAEELRDFFAGQDRGAPLPSVLDTLTHAPCAASTVFREREPVQRGGAVRPDSVAGYELLEELGRGGMGVVYKAVQVGLKRTVALKMILAGSHAGTAQLARFRTEAEAVARLHHPNIVQIHEVGAHAAGPYLSLEYVEGGSLASRLDGTPWGGAPAARFVQALAEAIHYAHQRGVIHRDLKPGNVLLQAEAGDPAARANAVVDPKAAIKISDFGLAKQIDDSSGQTESGAVLGTPSYMAPEQARGLGNAVGPPADVYALGVILYELLTGRPPFRAATTLDTVLQVVYNEPVAPRLLNPKIARDLETICLKCLQKSPERRYRSAAELADDLARYLRKEPIQARPISGAERLWRWCRRHPARAASGALALGALLVVLGSGAWFNRRLDDQLRETQAAERQLQSSLTRQAAERLDSDLRQLAAIPQLMAATLAERADWTEGQLEAWMQAALAKDSRVYGICAAFEPYRFLPELRDYALYVRRTANGPETKRLELPSYTPVYREWPWYRRPRQERCASWSEPFLDEGGGNVPMLTYSVPLERKGEFVGVLTADLSVDYFQVLRGWLDELSPDGDDYAFVVSPTGTFISHPNPAYHFPGKLTEIPEFNDDAALHALTTKMLKQETGRVRAMDPWTGRASTFLYAPVPTSKWSVAVVLAD